MNMNSTFRITAPVLLAAAFWWLPAQKAQASCTSDAIACVGNASGVVGACAAAAITDGFLLAGCVAALSGSVGACKAATQSCAVKEPVNEPLAVSTDALGTLTNFAANSSYQDISCSRTNYDLVSGLEYRMNFNRLVYLRVYCASGDTREFNNAEPGEVPYRRVNGIAARTMTCDLGEFAIGVKGTVDSATGYIKSIAGQCREVKYQEQIQAFDEIGSLDPTKTVAAGCGAPYFMAGLRVYYEKNKAVDRTRIVRGLQILCRQ